LIVRVSGDQNAHLVFFECLCRGVERGPPRRQNLITVVVEGDALDHARETLDLFGYLVGATVRILEPVLRFGLLRAFIGVVVDAVAILVVARAAIDGSRRLRRTLVVGIGHAIPVRVGAGTRLLGTTVRSYARLI